jgi:hypothetical protein
VFLRRRTVYNFQSQTPFSSSLLRGSVGIRGWWRLGLVLVHRGDSFVPFRAGCMPCEVVVGVVGGFGG